MTRTASLLLFLFFVTAAVPVFAQSAGDACSTAKQVVRVESNQGPGLICNGSTLEVYESVDTGPLRKGIGLINPASTLDVNGGVRIGADAASCTAAKEGTIRYVAATDAWEFCNATAWTTLGGGSGLPGGAAQYQMLRQGASAAQWEDAPYDIAMWWPGKPIGSSKVRIIIPRATQLPQNLTDSQCKAGTAATASTTVTLNKISGGSTTSMGTAVWSAAGTTCSFTFSAAVNLAAGDMVEFLFPASADATLADIAITLAGVRK